MTLYVQPISEEERAHLDKIIAESKPETLGARAHIILLSSQGYSSTEIASLVGRHPASVRKWIHRYNEHGISSLTEPGALGRKRCYTDEQAQRMVEIVLTHPRALGQPYSKWSLYRLARYFIKTGVVKAISHDTVWRILRARGIHFQKGKGWSRSEPSEKE